jgi:hypothetical protein
VLECVTWGLRGDDELLATVRRCGVAAPSCGRLLRGRRSRAKRANE